MTPRWLLLLGLAALFVSSGCATPKSSDGDGAATADAGSPSPGASFACDARIEIVLSGAAVPPLPVPAGSMLESVVRNGTGARCVDATTAGIAQAELWAVAGTAAVVGPVPFEWQGRAYDVVVPAFLRTVVLAGERIAQGAPTNETMVTSHPRLGDLIAKLDAGLTTSISVSDAEAVEALTVLGFATSQPGQGSYEVQLGEKAYRVYAMW